MAKFAWWRVGAVVAAGGVVASIACFGLCFGIPCVGPFVRYGLWTDVCPVGTPNLELSVSAGGILRGEVATIDVTSVARFVASHNPNAPVRSASFVRGVALDAVLLDDAGAPVPESGVEGWKRRSSANVAQFRVPDLPDGDYTLRVTGTTGFGEAVVDVPIALYTPALAHVLTDRPLYRPGQTVLLRSLVLARTDLAPLDGRPGRWRITAPDGSEMLVEKDRAATWGVADTTFPLDPRAPEGTWRARYETGDAHDEVTFDVRQFRLPRLSVDVKAGDPWYGVGDDVVVKGRATYTSGAPVANAPVVVDVRAASGRWPMPLAWEESFTATTDAEGSFTVDLGEVPVDLVERNAFTATARVTEEAGEVTVGSASIIVSHDDLWVDAVTELGDGLVGGFNNRAYLRIRRPDGTPVPEASVVVENPWDETEPARTGTADVDGVVALQLDPGDPVTVVDPPIPVRVRPLDVGTPHLSGAEDLTTSDVTLADRRAADRVLPAVAACGDLAPGGATVHTGLHLDASGRVREVQVGPSHAADCVAAAVRSLAFPPGVPRTLELDWYVPDSLRPTLGVEVDAVFGDGSEVRSAIAAATVRARSCIGRDHGENGAMVARIQWSTDEGSDVVRVSAVPTSDHGLSGAEVGCVLSRLGGVRLGDDADRDDLGTAVLRLSVPHAPTPPAPPQQTRLAYELRVTAAVDGARVGSGRLVLPAGVVPDLRLRATPSLASPGDDVVIEMFRGPGHRGDLPTHLAMYQGASFVASNPVDPASRSATFRIPDDGRGFFHVDAGGGRALVFVLPKDPLRVEVTSEASSYAPGAEATLTVRTTAGDRPIEAGVLLVGLDESLGQLAPLLGPDEYGRVTVRATSDRPAFDVFDARALALGAIRGENAAKAAVLRVSSVPSDAAGDVAVWASGRTLPKEEEALLGSFYRTYEALLPRVRAWERDAPAGEVMTPDVLARLWDLTVDELDAAGTPAVDGFGRRLSLGMLPRALLVQVDPRVVVQDGTRLPEDVVDFETWVREEVRR